MLYLGEINDSQQAAWRETLDVFDESEQQFTELSLFPEDRDLPSDAVNSIQIKLDRMELHRPRAWGDCWLGGELWRQLQLDEFWSAQLPSNREAVPWEKVLQLLVVNRLIRLPKDGEAVTRQRFTFAVIQDKLRKAELRDGHYLLRSNLAGDLC